MYQIFLGLSTNINPEILDVQNTQQRKKYTQEEYLILFDKGTIHLTCINLNFIMTTFGFRDHKLYLCCLLRVCILESQIEHKKDSIF